MGSGQLKPYRNSRAGGQIITQVIVAGETFGHPGLFINERRGADNSPAAVVTGLFYGGGANQLIGQAMGSLAVTAASLGVGLALMYGVKLTGTLRVSKEGELEELDLHEHGGTAYPELAGAMHVVGAERELSHGAAHAATAKPAY